MKQFTIALLVVLGVTVTGALVAVGQVDSEMTQGVQDRVAVAFRKLVDAEQDWRAAQAAQEELGSIGEAALSAIQRGASHHENPRVRQACFDLLTSTFAAYESALQTAANDGLADDNARIRYMCAFRLGEHRFFPAHRRLRLMLEQAEPGDLEQFTAAKSLAELGEADVMRVLYDAVASDWYMHRYVGNIGLKALSGKDLTDFKGYEYHEGAFVSGGREMVPMFDAVEQSQRRAMRYAAMTEFFKWLQQEKADLYKHATAAR